MSAWSYYQLLTLRLISPSSILCRFLFSVKTTVIQTTCCRPVLCYCAVIKSLITPSDQLFALVDQVRSHFTVTHELLEAQKVQAASPQAEERVDY